MPETGLLERLLAAIATLCARRPWRVLVVALGLGVVAWLAASTMAVDATFLGIVNEDDKDARHFRDVSKAYGGSGNLLLLVESDDLERSKAFVVALAPRLEALGETVKGVDWKIGETLTLPNGIVPLGAERIRVLTQAVKAHPEVAAGFAAEPGLGAVTNIADVQLNEALRAGAQGQGGDLAELDPLLELLEGALAAEPVRLPTDRDLAALIGATGDDSLRNWERRFVRDGVIASPDGGAMLATVRLRIDALDTALGIDCFGDIERATDEARREFPGVTAAYAGAPAYGYEDQQNVLSRTRTLSGLSLLLVLALFFYVDRSWLGPVIVGLPLLLGTLWTFGFVKLLIGYVSITSAVFGILLFGLGVDFAIHIVVRYNDAVAEGAEHEDALREALVQTGRGVVTGALTSAMAFFGLLVTDQKAARHLGITTGTGLLCCLVAMVVVLPALLTLTRPLRARGERSSMTVAWLDHWVGFVIRWPKAVLAIVAVFMIASLALLPGARIEYDIEKIATRGSKALVVKRRIKKIFGLSTDFALVPCDSVAEAAEVTAKLRAEGDEVARVDSISDLLPADREAADVALAELTKAFSVAAGGALTPLSEPRVTARHRRDFFNYLRKLAALLAMRAGVKDEGAEAARVRSRRVGRLVEVMAEDPKRTRDRLRALDGALRGIFAPVLTPILAGEARAAKPEDLPAALRGRFVDAKGRIIVLAFPRRSMLDGEAIKGFFDRLDAINPRSTGVGKIVRLFIVQSLEDLPTLVIVVSIVVMVIVTFDFRSPRLACLVFVPLIAASIIATGLVLASGQVISVLMLAGFPLILGIGVDDGVHLTHRFLEDPELGVVHAVSRTGKAILLTSVTTMVSFGGLLLMNHHGLEGLGFLVTAGVGLCFVASVTVFPAVLVLVQRQLPSARRIDAPSSTAAGPGEPIATDRAGATGEEPTPNGDSS